GTAGALLLERLGTAAADLGPGLGAVGAGAAGGQLGRDHLVHHGDVRLDPEDLVGQLDRAGVSAGRGAQGDLHRHFPPFTASRTITTPPLGPGTEPLTSSRFRSASAWTTSRL